jgi:hypothetical protein
MEDEEEYIDLHALTDKEWAQIKKTCIQVYDSQHHENKDMFKATIAGFCVWLMHAEKSLGIAVDDPKELH